MAIRISKLSIADANTVFSFVLRLLNELGEESDDLGKLDREKVLRAWREAGDRFHVLAANDDAGEIVGLLTLNEAFAIYANGKYGVIDEMYVVPHLRSSRVGKMLMDAVKELAMERRWTRIEVTAPESDRWVRTRRFYEREGFTFTGPKLKFLFDPPAK